jgi:glycosyltransferase involved in cell wall biosynthesis
MQIEIIDTPVRKCPTLCLNMIVKNESRIISRLLESVAGVIDTYCICDTGSTDNTIDIIKTFFDKKCPGSREKSEESKIRVLTSGKKTEKFRTTLVCMVSGFVVSFFLDGEKSEHPDTFFRDSRTFGRNN